MQSIKNSVVAFGSDAYSACAGTVTKISTCIQNIAYKIKNCVADFFTSYSDNHKNLVIQNKQMAKDLKEWKEEYENLENANFHMCNEIRGLDAQNEELVSEIDSLKGQLRKVNSANRSLRSREADLVGIFGLNSFKKQLSGSKK